MRPENLTPSNSEHPRILVADPSPVRRTAVLASLADLPYCFVPVTTTSGALEELAGQNIAAVIADIHLPGAGAIELCRRVKAGLPLLPVVILARTSDFEAEVAALEAGADAFFNGPLRPGALRARIRSAVRGSVRTTASDETENVLLMLAQSVEGRDPALGEHCERLALIAAAIGVKLGLSACEILALRRGGFLHDVGKVGIPDSVLLKPGPLTDEEWKVMRTHPERGERICSALPSLGPVLPIIRHHHERWDGSGYPDKLKGEQIPLLARILQIADIYDALTAARPYKQAFTSAQALQIMWEEVRKGWRDPGLMAVFEEIALIFEPGPDPESASASLTALADSIDRYREPPVPTEMDTVKLVSGL